MSYWAGSGVNSVEVPYDKFTCDNEECAYDNEAGHAMTDDYGNYEVECQFCNCVYYRSSIAEDKADWRASNYDY